MRAESAPPAATRRGRIALGALLVLAVSLAFRLACLPLSSESNMDPDAAHFLNLAREFGRGHGFVNPAAWPAWMRPERLPMPETFKEPGYPFAIAALTPLARDPFRAGQWISMIAGTLLPLLVLALGLRLGLGPGVAAGAGLLAAASPALTAYSTRVMVDALFPALLATTFLAAAGPRGRPGLAGAALAGAALGLAYLTRAQTLLAIPALAWLLARGRGWRAWKPLALAAVVAVAVASPLLVRNLRLFGAPHHSDVAAFGLWPYVDQVAFEHGLDHPPAPLAWALEHPVRVARRWLSSAREFGLHTLPGELLGSWAWVALLAVGLARSGGLSGPLGFAWLLLATTFGLVFAVHWDARYLTSIVPALALFAALGGEAAAGWASRFARGRRPGWALGLLGAVLLVLQLPAARAATRVDHQPELDAARREAPFVRATLAPDEAVMVTRTSYWSWFADRPSVHVVIADSARLADEIRRLRVRLAAVEISRLDDYAAHYPGGRWPACFVPLREDRALDMALFRVTGPDSVRR